MLEGGLLKPKATSIVDETSDQLKILASGGSPDANVLKELKKRRLVQQVYALGAAPLRGGMQHGRLNPRLLVRSRVAPPYRSRTFKPFHVSKGPEFALAIPQQATDLTADMIATYVAPRGDAAAR